MKDLVLFKTFGTEIEAKIVSGKLEASGIHTIVEAGNVFPYLSFFTPGRDGVRLKVFAQDLDKAIQLVENE